ncbi:MAG: hypothetical protein LUH05_05020 [Candidatus Gastranaerophilales bacterium]|nr:hypothetical protein [Candidatus Gastranaerophilales bacterium]
MEFKEINCKMKEIYYTPAPMKEDVESLKFQYKFWNSMNIIAMQNMTVQTMKMA